MTDLVGFGLEILGVFLGVGAAFLLDRLADQLSEKKEYLRVLILIRHELDADVTVLEKFRTNFDKAENQPSHYHVPYYHLRMSMWQGISSKVDSIKDEALLTQIALVYYNYDTFERMLNSYLDLALAAIKAPHNVAETNIEASIENRCKGLLVEINGDQTGKGSIELTKQTITSIDTELRRLKDC